MSRFDFLNQAMKVGCIGAVAALLPDAAVTKLLGAPPPNQNKWLMCVNCYSLFYNGYSNKGRCPTKAPHTAGEADHSDGFILTYDSPGPGQHDWRFCNKCHALFFDGYPQKGVCAAGGGHVAAGYNFTLRYDAKAEGTKNWRYCNKCHVLYFENYSKKGLCATGGLHVAAGYNFVLDTVHYTF
jgi:hypothetical protein